MCVFLYNPTLFYSVSLIYFFRAATAFDIFGTDNAEELLTWCGASQCGAKSNIFNPSLGLRSGTLLLTVSCDVMRQTPPKHQPWRRRFCPARVQRRSFLEYRRSDARATQPRGWSRQPAKDINRLIKIKE